MRRLPDSSIICLYSILLYLSLKVRQKRTADLLDGPGGQTYCGGNDFCRAFGHLDQAATWRGWFMDKKSCPFCGKPVSFSLDRCPFCREAIPTVRLGPNASSGSGDGRANIRRGLLWALLAGV